MILLDYSLEQLLEHFKGVPAYKVKQLFKWLIKDVDFDEMTDLAKDFREKLKWTALILVLYYILTLIPLYGLAEGAVDQFAALRAVMAGSFGSILTLGIGPIVTASIVLQLLVGSNLLDLDLFLELCIFHSDIFFKNKNKKITKKKRI